MSCPVRVFWRFLLLMPLWIVGVASGASNADYAALPPTLPAMVDPNVMLNLSIETPMQGAAYNDQPDGAGCAGRINDGGTVGICYSHATTYIGYFDPDKCYTYTNSRFEPASVANNHQCSGQWSGNFLNWASMTAIDEFRWALTGGNRQTDTTTLTVLERANMGLAKGDGWFPVKMITASKNVAPSTVTPYPDAKIYIYNHNYQMDIGTSWGGNQKAANLNLRVKVCDTGVKLEDNCIPYSSFYKPQGLIQNNAYRMRFALMSYTRDNSMARHGGVLRANMKYVGPLRPAASGGMEINPNAEFDSNGIFKANPDQVSLTAGVTDSGVINYLNKFGASGYKSYDPIGELYYECLNYFKHRGATAEYSAGLTDAQKDGFPVVTAWSDPIQHACQGNFIIGLNDANPWLDKRLPGTAVTGNRYFGGTSRLLAQDATDYGNPSNSDPDIDITAWTNTVGDLEQLTGTSQCVGCTSTTCDMNATNKTITALGRVFGTCPYPGKENSYYIAGLSYYAHTMDLRPDWPGKQSISTFMVDTQEYSATPLTGPMNMLWLAGKYGGFKESDHQDTNGDGNPDEPNLVTEWDADEDGQPDHYVLASDPSQLVDGLTRAFADIMERVSSGTAASVVANSYAGTGAVYQALYNPKVDIGGRQVQWGGILHALFIDDHSRFREDGNANGTLDDCLIDPVVDIYFDSVNKLTKVRRYTTGADCTIDGAPYVEVSIEQLRPLWDARALLARVANLTTQRNYATQPAISGRHITTWLDSNGNGSVDSGEQISFDATQFSTAARYYYLRAASATEASNIVKFVRGQEVAGYRSRTIDYDGNGTLSVWRLGDIIHSTPVVVAAPGETYGRRYDQLYRDASYQTFHAQYAKRRQVVYVGANDGLLHAFNAGFWNESTKSFATTQGNYLQHALGDELWAYAPFNLLPHLKWLTQLSYNHVYYMDGSPQAFDAKIFPADADHPGGWGTVLVAGMGLGGGPLDIDNNGIPDTRSAYVVMDITNPEVPPKLMAELTHPAMGFTVSQPALAMRRSPAADGNWNNPSHNDWHLIFGSGPTQLSTVTSEQNARLFVYDLVNRSWLAGFAPYDLGNIPGAGGGGSGIATSFVPSVVAMDWNLDYTTDTVYLGSDGILAADYSQAGRLFRMDYSAWNTPTITSLFNPGKPFNALPLVTRDAHGEHWIVAGSGRLWNSNGNTTTWQQTLYGIKDPNNGAEIAAGDLQNVTGVLVTSNQAVLDLQGVLANVTPSVADYAGLEVALKTRSGWYKDLTTNGGNPSERSLSEIKQIERLAAFTLYTPSSNPCEAEGNSTLNILCYGTGTSCPPAALSTTSVLVNGVLQDGVVVGSVSLGTGIASTPVIHRGSGAGNPTVITQSSTGALTRTEVALPTPPSGRISWRELKLD
ncbi:MAG: PilC/PilY family type IV pilus protein [Magnetococcus sp. MYC-9]